MAINVAGQFCQERLASASAQRLMRSPDCVQQPAWNFRLSSHWQSNLHEDILCRHVRRNVVFNRSTCDDENCTLVDNVLTNRLVTTLARNRAGRIFVYFAMEHCVRLIRETVAQQYRRPNATFCPSPQRPNAFWLAAIRLMALLVALHW